MEFNGQANYKEEKPFSLEQVKIYLKIIGFSYFSSLYFRRFCGKAHTDSPQ